MNHPDGTWVQSRSSPSNGSFERPRRRCPRRNRGTATQTKRDLSRCESPHRVVRAVFERRRRRPPPHRWPVGCEASGTTAVRPQPNGRANAGEIWALTTQTGAPDPRSKIIILLYLVNRPVSGSCGRLGPTASADGMTLSVAPSGRRPFEIVTVFLSYCKIETMEYLHVDVSAFVCTLLNFRRGYHMRVSVCIVACIGLT